jgi:hypothetical protein
MDYEELKDLVQQKSEKTEEYTVLTKKIEEVRSYLSKIEMKIMEDLNLTHPKSAISTGGNAVNTTALISIGNRQINFWYDEKESIIKVQCYEPRVIENTIIDTLVYDGGNIVHKETKENFELDDIKKYLEWFKK